jgi:amino acid adenylation domain-containing protein
VPSSTDDCTLIDRLAWWSRQSPDRCAFTFLRSDSTVRATLSFAELWQSASRLANGLSEIVGPGDVVILGFNSELEFIEAFLACQIAGIIAAPTSLPRFRSGAERLAAITRHSEARLILTGADTADALRQMLDALKDSAKTRVVAAPSLRSSQEKSFVSPTPNAVAIVQYTSGSTGTPKGAVLTHANIMAHQALIQKTFGHNADTVMAGVLPLFHDMGLIGTVLQPLYLGTSCILISPAAFLRRPACWLEAISRYGVTTTGGPNSLFDVCVDRISDDELAGIDLSHWSVAFNGADHVRAQTLQRFHQRFGRFGFRASAFYPCYGLAEATLLVSGGREGAETTAVIRAVDRIALRRNRVKPPGTSELQLVSCGLPSAPDSVRIVNPRSRVELEFDTIGEIWVRSDSVAIGYWRDSTATAKTFGGRLDGESGTYLRTGDLGFLDQRGHLFVTGRCKDLIIVHGQNIYPHDIEDTASAVDPCLGQAAAFQMDSEEAGLVLLLEPSSDASREITTANTAPLLKKVRTSIHRAHGIAFDVVAIVACNSLPRTTSGKLRRSAAADAWQNGTIKVVAQERAVGGGANAGGPVAAALAEVLGIESAEIGSWLPLVTRGVDSVRAASIANALERKGIICSLTVLLSAETLDEIETGCSLLPEEGLAPATSDEELPLSEWQKPFWFAQTIRPESVANNVKLAVKVIEDLDTSLWCQAVTTIIERHDILRITICESGDRSPRQKLTSDAAQTILVTDATDLSEEQIEQHVSRSVNAPFTLSQETPFRAEVLRTKSGTILLFVAHHIAVDLWSMATMFKETMEAYCALRSGEAVPRSSPSSLRQFLARHAMAVTRAREEGLSYWRNKLSGDFETLELPLDRCRPRQVSEQGARHAFEIDRGDLEQLRALAARSHATLHMVLLSIYRVLLYRYTSQSDVLIGTPLTQRRAGDEEMLGCFVNPVAVRCRVDSRSTFADVLSEIRQTMLDALQHGGVPIHDVVREAGRGRPDGHHQPLYQTMFALQAIPAIPEAAPLIIGHSQGPLSIGGIKVASYFIREVEVPFDLALMIAEGKDQLWACFEYRTCVLDQRTVQSFALHFRRLLRAVVENAYCSISELTMLDADDLLLLEEFQRGPDNLPAGPSSIYELIADHVKRAPGSLAIRSPLRQVTYRELDDMARDLAFALRDQGVCPEDRIGIAMQPSAEWVAAILAVWLSGATVVTLDRSVPPDRLREIRETTELSLVICDDDPSDALVNTLGDILKRWGDFGRHKDPVCDFYPDEFDRQRLAYIAFTSGSSGKPKGVMITHEGAINFALAQSALIEPAAFRRVLQITPASFDAAFSDLFMSLTTGGTLCIAPAEARIPGRELADFINRERITLMTVTPSVLATLKPSDCASVVAVIAMGETCTVERARSWSTVSSFFNGYGPTEATIGTTLGRFDPTLVTRFGTLAIGRPFANYNVFLLDGDFNQVPVGAAGELFVAGPGVARGYASHPDWTAERFVPCPYGRPGERMYRTGDWARWLANGTLEFLGRTDRQIKLRGVRIEPAEIEIALRAHSAVVDCYVDILREDGRDENLVAYVVGPDENELSHLPGFLSRQFPPFMIPGRFVTLDRIPLRSNGKLDRDKLPPAAKARTPTPPVNSLEDLLRAAWSEVLGVTVTGVDDNFFDLGGHSLLLHRLQGAVESHTGFSVAVLDFFDYPTVRSLASHLASTGSRARPDPALPLIGSTHSARPPIAIIGIAGTFPGAPDIKSFWSNIISGRESITFFSTEELFAAGVGTADPDFVPARGIIEGIEDFDAPFFGFSVREASILDPQKRLLLELAQKSLDDAGYAPQDGSMQNDFGVFVGSSRNSYFVSNVATHQDIVESLGAMKIGIASDPGFAATLIGYKLNLSGPCLNIDTACSTSLVAVHQACQSLWLGECRMALAGGASIDVPVVGGHHYEEGLIASPDGHCRPFDALAAGTVKGMGGGMVVLKPLDAAWTDGDNIYAIIRSSAINNDGAHKLGFIAPSPEGQALVVRRALQAADISPSTLGYIEAHGTGTALGDPIEVLGLNKALAGAPAASIAIGSVKANIGHLDAASGIAGLIKCALVVSHGLIPPQVHLQEPNPKIDWAGGPLYIPTKLLEWPRGAGPRRASASSFGIGGTNAHVVLEEAPARPSSVEADAAPCLVLLSAGSAASLRATATSLAASLRDRNVDLKDLAFTLGAGRRRLQWRKTFVADSVAALSEQLVTPTWEPVAAAVSPSNLLIAFPSEATPIDISVVAQMVKQAPAFAAALEECRALSDPAVGKLLEEILRPSDHVQLAILPQFTCPLIFVIEYAFWSSLRSSGVQPHGFLGLGVGELAALCAAGSISLADSLALAFEWGSMTEAGQRHERSSVAALLSAGAEEVQWSKPQLYVYSAATGGLLEEVNAAHWITVVNGPQRFDEALAAALKHGVAIAMEAGPSPSLFEELHSHSELGSLEAYSLAFPDKAQDAFLHALRMLGRLWEIGAIVNVNALIQPARRISLPGVAFDRTRVWLDAAKKEEATLVESRMPEHADLVAQIWEKFLGQVNVGPDDEFFASGGDSLLAIEMAAELGERLGISLPPQTIFEHSTFSALSNYVLSAGQTPPAMLRATNSQSTEQRTQLSTQQRGLYLAHELEGAGASLILSFVVRFDGPIDSDTLQNAFRLLLARHAVLLHNFDLSGEGGVQWRAHDPSELVLTSQECEPSEWESVVQQQANTPFSISSDLLLRGKLLTNGPQSSLVIAVHHLVADGWSLLVMLEDLATFYHSPAAPMLPAPSYADYVSRQLRLAETSGTVSEAKRQKLRDLPVVELPGTRSSPAPGGDAAKSVSLTLDRDLTSRIRATCRKNNLTLFAYLLSAFEVLVRRFIQEDEVVIASPITNRRTQTDRETVGPFVGLAVFRHRVRLDQTFVDLASEVRDSVAVELEPSLAPLEELLSDLQLYRNRDESPFRIAFALNHAAPESVAFGPDTTAHPRMTARESSRHRVMMWIDENGPELSCTLEYRTSFYEGATIHRYLSAFVRILVTTCQDPAQEIGSIDILGDRDRKLLEQWNQTSAPRPAWSFVQNEVARMAASNPHAPAISCDGRVLDYGTLDAEARRVARLLLERGIAVEDRVAIFLDRGFEFIVAALGALYAGGCYLPLDPELPTARIQRTIETSLARFVIAKDRVHEIPDGVTVIDFAVEPEDIASTPDLPISIDPRNLAYVMFTSGSTGSPKGVMIEHRALANRLDWMIEEFRFTQADRVLHKTPVSFDVSVWEIFAPLVVGATVVVAKPGGHRDPGYLNALIARENVSILHFVPSMLKLFLDQAAPAPSLRFVICSGEVLATEVYERASAWAGNRDKVINLYGPTEAAIDVTSWNNQSDPGVVSIGRPIQNIRIHILDEQFQRVAIGVAGELCIAGMGLARGYIGAPELTAERFYPDPFCDGSLLYRTGDRARWNESGAIEYLGRLDSQIKLRGMRVELAEIEAVLRGHPAVDDVTVTVFGAEEQARLITHIVPDRQRHSLLHRAMQVIAPAASTGPAQPACSSSSFTTDLIEECGAQALRDSVRSYALSRLPRYMIPDQIVFVTEMPVTVNGKLDRAALPERDLWSGLGSAPRQPITAMQQKLARTWQQVLGTDYPSLDTNFFECGGNSLSALRLVSAIEKELAVKIELAQLFAHPSLAELAAELEVAAAAERPLPIHSEVSQRFDPFPMTSVQQAYALGRSSAFELGNTSTHGYLELHARAVDRQRFTATLNKLIRRHDMLRATACGEGLLRVHADVPHYEPPFEDVSSSAPEEGQGVIERIRSEMSEAIFNLEKWPLFEVRLTKVTQELQIVHIAIDALIIDGSSAILLEREFNRLYLDQDDSPAVSELSFRDFAIARADERLGDRYKKARAYWKRRLEDLAAAPKLPLRAPISTIRSPRFRRARRLLRAQDWQALQERARGANLTTASILMTAYAEVLAKWSGDERFLINLPISNRPPNCPGVDEIIGNFTSTLNLEVDLRGAHSFTEKAQRIHRQMWSDLAHLEFDGVEMLRLRARQDRSFGEARTPFVFTGLLGLTPGDAGVGDKLFDIGLDAVGVSRTSQVLLDCVAIDRSDGLVLNWDHVTDAFAEGIIEEMLDAYLSRLQKFALNLIGESPLSSALPHWRAPQLELGAAAFEAGTLIEPVLKAAQRFPHRVAVVSGDTVLSYAELRALAGGVAATLRSGGIKRGDVVAIHAEKGWEQVVGALGILLAGAAYVPVETNLPLERRRRIIKESGARIIVTQAGLVESLADSGCATVLVKRDGPRDSQIEENVTSSDLAYIMFTSGSTGTPKGVAMEHGAAANTVRHINKCFGITNQDAVLCVSGLGFDLSVYDMFGLLAVGGKLVFPEASQLFEADDWWRLIKLHQVTIWNTTPLLAAHLWAQADHESHSFGAPLRLFLLSGDWIPLDLPSRIRSLIPQAQVVSLGGATEAAIWSIYYDIDRVDPSWQSIPYGRPLPGQDVVVLDRILEHCPTWVTGDIYIGGHGLARQYWNDPAQTASSFIYHPRWNTRLYRTGDLGRYRPDGNIEFLGRSDSQIKLDGVRLELGEVESEIESVRGITRAVVLPDREGGREVKRLVGFVSLAPNALEVEAAREMVADTETCRQTWHSILAAQALAAANEGKLDREAFGSFILGLEEQYRAAIVELFAGFRELTPGSQVSLDDLLLQQGIALRYRNWMARSLAYLTEKDCFTRLSPDTYEVRVALDKLLEDSSTRSDVPLKKILCEEVHSAELYTRAQTSASYQAYYHLCHRIAAAVMGERARLAGSESLRVMEVGAGYGSLTEHVLPLLRTHDTYEFTDVSNFFLGRAAERLAQYKFVRFDHFDIDIDPQLQDCRRHTYDAVIAASVLHNARNIPRALAHLRSLLAPGGILLLIEETSFFPFFDLGMGLQQGFGDFEDPTRPRHPLLSRAEWTRALSEAGFIRSALLNRPDTIEDAIGFDVIVAQGPETVSVFNAAEVSKHLTQFIPRSAIPAVWIELREFPRTPNGKIDRQSLRLPLNSKRQGPGSYLAPRTDTERTLAQIWANAMGRTEVSVVDDFFEMGGDSLVASRVVAELRNSFAVDVQLRALFQTSTIEGLAALIDAARVPHKTQSEAETYVEGQL